MTRIGERIKFMNQGAPVPSPWNGGNRGPERLYDFLEIQLVPPYFSSLSTKQIYVQN